MQNKEKGTNPASIRPTDVRTGDTGKVKLGGTSPSLPTVQAGSPTIADGGKIRLGGTAPSL